MWKFKGTVEARGSPAGCPMSERCNANQKAPKELFLSTNPALFAPGLQDKLLLSCPSPLEGQESIFSLHVLGQNKLKKPIRFILLDGTVQSQQFICAHRTQEQPCPAAYCFNQAMADPGHPSPWGTSAGTRWHKNS